MIMIVQWPFQEPELELLTIFVRPFARPNFQAKKNTQSINGQNWLVKTVPLYHILYHTMSIYFCHLSNPYGHIFHIRSSILGSWNSHSSEVMMDEDYQNMASQR